MSEQRLRDPARLAALADALEQVAIEFAPGKEVAEKAAAILRALAEQEPRAWMHPENETLLHEWQRGSMLKFPGTRAAIMAEQHTVPLYTLPKEAG